MAPAVPRITRADFETSAAEPAGWPPLVGSAGGEPDPHEIAFVGRSNVGKSSLLNALVERKGLARTSAEPGRTRLINFFRVDILTAEGARHPLRLVDLPGFGYAKVSKSERATWRPAIERYLSARSALRAVVLLVDARRIPEARTPPDEAEALIGEERALSDWIAARGVEVIPVITKSDKLAKHERTLAADRLRRLFGRPPVLASALSLDGRDRLWARLLAGLAPRGDVATDGGAQGALTASEPSD